MVPDILLEAIDSHVRRTQESSPMSRPLTRSDAARELLILGVRGLAPSIDSPRTDHLTRLDVVPRSKY